MAKYFYQARTLQGESMSGSADAEDEMDLARNLRKEGYLLISAKSEKKRRFKFSIPVFGRTPLVAKLMFAKNLKVMVSAGVSLPRALGILSNQIKNKSLRKALLKIKDQVLKGEAFSDSLKLYPEIFSDLFISMIRVGEETGTLEDVLEVLASHMEKDHQLRSKVKSALIYPAVILAVMLVIGAIMIIFVVPKLSEVFDELNVELPATTRAIISAGNFLAKFWYLMPVFLMLAAFLFRAILKTKRGKYLYDTLMLKIPGISGLVKKTNSAYTMRTLSSLIFAGVPIVRSMEIASDTLNNSHYKEAMQQASEKIKKGSSLSESLKGSESIYPSLVMQMIEVGEETGETGEMLKKLAEFFEDEVSNATKNLSTIIEPALMIVIGAAVALFAVSIIQPIYGIMESM